MNSERNSSVFFNVNVVKISEELLLAVKMGNDNTQLENDIASLDEDQLIAELTGQEERLAFWLNLYNAFFQIKVKSDPGIFSRKARLFFGRHFGVAGRKMSLDEIEHDMLRRSTYKWSLGYIRKPFPSKFKKALRVEKLDPRVHFAMNCGAKSCPPIRTYESKHIHDQLDLATKSFLSQEVNYDSASNTAHATSLFNWFRGDFGGKKGIRQVLLKYELIPSTKVKLKFTRYSWEKAFENYA